MLDLIFTNNVDLIHNFSILPSPKSDHFLIEVSVVYKEPSVSEVEHSSMTDAVDGGDPDFDDLNFFSEKIDWNLLEMDLDRCMDCLDFQGLSSSFMMDRFLSTCLSVAREFVPLRKILPKHKHKILKDRRILMRRRHRIIQQRAVATGGAWRDALNHCLAEIEKSLQQSHLQQADFEEDRAVENIKRNPKFFYAYARKFSKIRVGIGPLIDATNSVITC